MSRSYRLSIIVPVYNTEQYVAKCLKSCLNQNVAGDEYEIIVINDGSTDSSMVEVMKLMSAHPHIKLSSQPNSGLSAARNAGLDLASGEYVWFVDSDDSIMENCLPQIFGAASGADIIAFGYDFPVSAMPGPEFVLATKGHFQHGAPYYIFRRQFLKEKSLRFFPGIYHEDSDFTPRALCLAKSVAIIQQECYCRYIREGSITQTVNVKRAYDLLFIIARLDEFIRGTLPDGPLRRQMGRLLPLLANSSLNVMADAERSLWKEYDKEFRMKDIAGYFLRSRDLVYMAEGLLLSASRSPVKTYRFFRKL